MIQGKVELQCALFSEQQGIINDHSGHHSYRPSGCFMHYCSPSPLAEAGSGGFLLPDEPDVPDVTIELAIATTALPNAIDGIRYTAVIEGAGGEKPYAWSVTNGGGTGFGINNEGILSGVAPRSGDYGLSLRLTDNANTQATASFVLTVTGDTPQPLAITTTSPLPSVEEGNTYTAILEAVGGNGGYLWLLENGGGSGLRLRDDGVLSWHVHPLKGNMALPCLLRMIRAQYRRF